MKAQGGQAKVPSPTVVDKQFLDNVVYIAAGRYHNLAIKKKMEVEEGDFD